MKKHLIVLGLLTAMVGCGKHDTSPLQPAAAASRLHSDAELKLRVNMRKLMAEHVIWTRSYVRSALNNDPDLVAETDRLLQNQDDTGALFGSFYDPIYGSAGQDLAALLREHIRIAAEIIDGIKTGDHAKFDAINRRWQKNGYDIADWMTQKNPNWDNKQLREMWDKHLSTTTTEAISRYQKDWVADVKAFDETYEHMLDMADVFSEGIIKQFPDKFR